MATHALPALQIPASHIIDDEAPATAAAAPARKSLLRSIYDAMLEAQMRRAQREIDSRLGAGALARAFATDLPKEL